MAAVLNIMAVFLTALLAVLAGVAFELTISCADVVAVFVCAYV